jgi:hypothetical protein
MSACARPPFFNLNHLLQLKSAGGRLCVAVVLFFAVGAPAQTNTLSDAEIQGRQLAPASK